MKQSQSWSKISNGEWRKGGQQEGGLTRSNLSLEILIEWQQKPDLERSQAVIDKQDLVLHPNVV